MLAVNFFIAGVLIIADMILRTEQEFTADIESNIILHAQMIDRDIIVYHQPVPGWSSAACGLPIPADTRSRSEERRPKTSGSAIA